MFFELNDEKNSLGEKWADVVTLKTMLIEENIELGTEMKMMKNELDKYKSDHESMEALRELKKRDYLTDDEWGLFNVQ